MSMITIRDEILHFAKQLKAFTLGPFNPSINVFHWLECLLHKHLPSNAHQLANGRLSVSMTRMSDGKHIFMSEFQSKEDVVQALLCSCFVPMYCGVLPPSFRGVYYVDGGFSNMQPVLSVPYSQTLTVSPFSGETDICPADTPCMWDMVVSGSTLKGNMANSFRIINALYPMDLKILEQAYHSGYKDAFHFLQSNDLAPYLMIHKISQVPINCHQTKSLMNLTTTTDEEKEMKVEEKTTLTTFRTDRRMQTRNSTEHELTGNRPVKDPPLHFDMVKNVMLGNMVTYLSMFGLPARLLSNLLLPLMLSFYVWMGLQSEFQRVGAAMEKALSSQDLRAECAGGSVMMEELRQVGWGLVIEGFVCYEEDFEVDSQEDGEPVELMENRGDVVTGVRVGE
ncbi:patatin-like phospholipase domain-containing protein 2 [Epinephelus fuscoguttatus]|uniref:patatin-like phospholipase domain-containing protein 2 n=1 Tax=Epinephelus fuscoguttatus TaxID=293821 RepID=UPI0020D18A9B|nr:patatin-like phospholipase domain-containing protein 2 [Epinephelus fuscoguttatus]